MSGFDVVLKHRFAGGAALDISFASSAGVTALFGRSGAGKSSVIRAVAGLFEPDAAEITVAGERLDGVGVRVARHCRQLGVVFQEARLFPHMSVARNIAYGASGLPPERLSRIEEMLGLGPLMDRRPATLSGGEAQRVAIARALACQPRALLMDEPLASLDAARKAKVLPFLEALRAEAGVPILYVSHDIAEVARLADTLVLLEGGTVVASGPATDLLSDPALVPHLGVQNAGAVLPGTLAKRHAGDGLSEIALPAATLLVPEVEAPEGSPLRLRVPATDVMLARTRPEGLSALNIVPATVTGIEEGRGPGVMVQLALGPSRLLARITRRSARALDLAPGTEVFAILKTVAVAPGAIGAAPLAKAGD
ncbi:molybdenum ABC transporter ATP-binding protein [Pseudaestuariivita sp.]|uniref:molybdenum ABC transporter ATP-binding protein n=1 Tax=Pseudaestuariivita sp. TaxID=2211669 RepID=UPI004057DB1B